MAAKKKRAKKKITLTGLSPLAYEHPTDRAALVSLSKVPGIERLLRFAFRLIHERRARLHFLSSAVRVSEKQFPEVHKLHMDACKILDVEHPPELYVTQTPVPNAFAYGVDNPFIVLHSSILDLLDPQEQQSVIAHELGHITAGHMLHYSILQSLLNLMRVGGVGLPFGNLGLRVFILALFEWYRKAELTCDRAALLVSQDPTVCHHTNMKLAGGHRIKDMDLDAFFEQAVEYESQDDLIDSVYKIFNNWGATHPHPVARVRELQKWVDSGAYEAILAGHYINRDEAEHTSAVTAWRQAVEEVSRGVKSRGTHQSADAVSSLVREAKDFGTAPGRKVGGWLRRIIEAAEDDLEKRQEEAGVDPETNAPKKKVTKKKKSTPKKKTPPKKKPKGKDDDDDEPTPPNNKKMG